MAHYLIIRNPPDIPGFHRMYKNARAFAATLICAFFCFTTIYALPLDSDRDGIPDTVEGDADADKDGIPNYLDRDSDGDRVPDTLERGDSDGDGVPNYLDTDSDNDGIDDSIEAQVSGLDTDKDGIDDFFDPDHAAAQWEMKIRFGLYRGVGDSNGDGVEDWFGQQVPIDTDRDGIRDLHDADSDDDGVPDTIEGTADWDGDGIPNYRDHDSDNDGLSDDMESLITRGDLDGDGIDNTFDVDLAEENDGSGEDNDKDGVDDAWEALGSADSDGDGVANMYDLDSDNDGIPDYFELGHDAANFDGDFDSDGFPDFVDLDADDDGIGDAIEASILTGVDTNNDSFIDVYFNGDIEYRKWSGIGVTTDDDSDRDGVHDAIEGSTDTDKDGVLDFLDQDSDNDGIPDFVEAQSPVADSDFDGIFDMHDLDSDNDGIYDLVEAQIPREILTEIDVDNNGRIDSTNKFRGDGIAKLVESISASGIENYQPVDTDGDGVFDFIDSDSDDDGLPDLVETSGLVVNADGRIKNFTDANGDGADDAIAFLPTPAVDSDGDGIANHLDSDSVRVVNIEEGDVASAEVSSPVDLINSSTGCSISPGTSVGYLDPTLPLLLLTGIVFLIFPQLRKYR